jgi:hypothetical protein
MISELQQHVVKLEYFAQVKVKFLVFLNER